jgi:predicted PurR-regulated permease PerM
MTTEFQSARYFQNAKYFQNARYFQSAKYFQNAKYPISKHAQRLVSSFGLWAIVLGLSPVLAFHLLMRS